jgi:LysM repeat protein
MPQRHLLSLYSLCLRVCAALVLVMLTACARTPVGGPATSPGLNLPGATNTPEREAILREAHGTVELRDDAAGQWAGTSLETRLGVGAQLRTGPDSRAFLQLTEGSKIRLGADTAITFNILNPFMDSLLTSLALDHGRVWVLLNDGALDVELPLGIASARTASMSVDYAAQTQTLVITCLVGTCSFNQTFIPANSKYLQEGLEPGQLAPMTLTDYGVWGVNVPEATQLAQYATEAIAQGNATLPVVITETPSPSPIPTATATVPPGQPTPTQPTPTMTFLPPPTEPLITPLPTARPIGRHRVQNGEGLYCIARVYGVLPAAIAQTNGLREPFTLFAGQTLIIPGVPWDRISSGPVCAPQFESPYPGRPYLTPTPTPPSAPAESATPAGALTVAEVAALCIGNCADPSAPTYRLRIIVTAAGGAPPLTYTPGREFDQDFPRCTKASGTVTVTSADGQTATGAWVYDDTACPGGTLTPLPR